MLGYIRKAYILRRVCINYEKDIIQKNSANIVLGTIDVKDNK